MGLLMSDITLIDPTVSDTLRLLDELGEWPYRLDVARDPDDRDSAVATD